MSDPFHDHLPGLTSPAGRAFVITPDDATDLPVSLRGIYLGGAGDLRVILVGDTAPVTFGQMAAGGVHGLRIRRVLATGTTATGLVGVL